MSTSNQNTAAILLAVSVADRADALAESLASAGHDTTSEADPVRAMARIRNGGWDLVIVDLSLPNDGATNIILTTTRNTPDMPVIVLAEPPLVADAVEALRSGAWDYVLTPLAEPATLLISIEKALERASLVRENRVYQERLEELVAERTRDIIQANEILIREVEAHRRTGEKLRQSESRLDSIMRSVPDIIYRVNLDGKITFINDAVRRYGYDPDQLLQSSIFNIIHPDDRERARNHINERRSGDRRTRTLELRLLNRAHNAVEFEVKIGDITPEPVFLIEAQGIYDSAVPNSETFIGTQGVARDITARKRTELSLSLRLRYEEGLAKCSRSLLEDSSSALTSALDHLLHGTDCGRVRVFQNSGNKTEHQVATLLASAHFRSAPPEWREDSTNELHYDDGFLRWAEDLRSSHHIAGTVSTFPESERRSLADQGVAAVMVVPVFLHDRWWGFLQFDDTRTDKQWENEDVVLLRMAADMFGRYFERKDSLLTLRKSEERLRTYIESAPIGVFVTDERSKLLEANRAACEMVLSPPEKVIGKPLGHFVTRKSRHHLMNGIKSLMAGGTYYGDLVFSRPDGTEFPMAISANALPGNRFIAFCRDLTEERRLELQLRQSQKMEAVGHLAGGIAHDFSNLLVPILTNAEMILMDLARDDPRREDVIQIQKTAERARDLTRQLLAFSRKQVLELRTVHAGEVVREFERMIRRTIREDIDLILSISHDAGNIRGDVAQIEQVLMNLAVNARDAMPHGGTLTIDVNNVVLGETRGATGEILPQGKYVRISVRDTGTGIDDELINRLFEPFVTTKQEGKGTGLGLSTAYGIVHQHGGSITVESEIDQGTTFDLYLPRVAGDVEHEEEEPDRTGYERGSETILIVEDEPTVRELTCRFLREHGYTVIEADSPRTCLEIAGQHSGALHMLLSDVVMPHMNGKMLYDKLLQLLPSLKVLYMSGHAHDVIAHHGVLEEGVHFLQKPFSVRALTSKVREVLDS
jgi:PAS domain S-box-containing protein